MNLQEIEAQVREIEERVDRLRALYEQYFSGIEKLEPLILRKEVDRRLWALRKLQIRNTALRFKLQTIVQRYNTFQQYWARICRDIENGTYHRDVAKAASRFGDAATQTALGKKRMAMFERGIQKRKERDAARAKSQEDISQEVSAAFEEAPSMPAALDSHPSVSGTRPLVQPPGLVPPNVPASQTDGVGRPGMGGIAGARMNPFHRNPFAEPGAPQKPAEPPSRPGPRPVPPPSATSPGGGPTDARLRQIYSEYVEAKRQCSESTASITFEGLAKTLRGATSQIQAKHKAKAVDFEVVVRDGKTVLKPVVKG